MNMLSVNWKSTDIFYDSRVLHILRPWCNTRRWQTRNRCVMRPRLCCARKKNRVGYVKLRRLLTFIWSIRRTSGDGTARTQTPVMQNKLNAADPTMVPGPRAPALKPLPTIWMHDKRISGALDPSDISVRLATVSFQT